MCFLIKYLLKKIKCTSKCSYNEELYDETLFTRNLNHYELKNKDIIKIGSILRKRSIKPHYPKRINIECEI
jgi:hypothetical protein